MRPKRSTAWSCSDCTCARSLTSVGTPSEPPMRDTASASAPASTSASTTRRPRSANADAIPNPIPLAAPVTTATSPGSSRIARS
jgi:hypothetical protein